MAFLLFLTFLFESKRYASLITIAMANTKLKDKAQDKDTWVASLMPSAMVSFADSYAAPLHDHAKKLVFPPLSFKQIK